VLHDVNKFAVVKIIRTIIKQFCDNIFEKEPQVVFNTNKKVEHLQNKKVLHS